MALTAGGGRSGAILAEQGHNATVFEDPELCDWQQYRDRLRWSLPSTTGQERLPDNVRRSFTALKIRWVFKPALRGDCAG